MNAAVRQGAVETWLNLTSDCDRLCVEVCHHRPQESVRLPKDRRRQASGISDAKTRNGKETHRGYDSVMYCVHLHLQRSHVSPSKYGLEVGVGIGARGFASSELCLRAFFDP